MLLPTLPALVGAADDVDVQETALKTLSLLVQLFGGEHRCISIVSRYSEHACTFQKVGGSQIFFGDSFQVITPSPFLDRPKIVNDVAERLQTLMYYKI